MKTEKQTAEQRLSTMDGPLIILDILLFASATASCIAGVFCGWQLRASRPHLDINESSQSDRLSKEAGAFLACHEPLGFDDDAGIGSNPDDIAIATERLLQMLEALKQSEAELIVQTNDPASGTLPFDPPPSVELIKSAVESLFIQNTGFKKTLSETKSRLRDANDLVVRFEAQATLDGLTNVKNRLALDNAISNWDDETNGFLALVDLDDFKRLNDQHGRVAGDRVLRSVADLLMKEFGDFGLVARYGGAVFSIVANNMTVDRISERLEATRIAIANLTDQHKGQELRVTCSIGLTRMIPGETAIDRLQRVDDALYMSKFAGKNCGHWIDCQKQGQAEKPVRIGTIAAAITGNAATTSQRTIPVSPSTPDPKSRANATEAKRVEPEMPRLPDLPFLESTYCELLRRIGKTRADFSVMSITVTQASGDAEIESTSDASQEHFIRLYKVVKSFCGISDKVGTMDASTLLICMPGTGSNKLEQRIDNLVQLVNADPVLSSLDVMIGRSSLILGDSFESLVSRTRIDVTTCATIQHTASC